MSNFYKHLNTKILGVEHMSDFKNIKDNYSREINQMLFRKSITHKFKPVVNVWKFECWNDFIDNPNLVWKSNLSERDKEYNHYYLSRVIGYLFENEVIKKYDLIQSSQEEDTKYKIDAWTKDGNAITITKKYKSFETKLIKGDFEIAKKYIPKGKKLFAIFIDYNGDLNMESC